MRFIPAVSRVRIPLSLWLERFGEIRSVFVLPVYSQLSGYRFHACMRICNQKAEKRAPIHEQMLMYSKEANNRKQEIDRQHHTIPNQRANDKHHGNVYNLLFRYGKVRSQNMEKLKSSFPTFCKRTFPQLHKIASYAHYAQCRLLRKPSHFIIYSRK